MEEIKTFFEMLTDIQYGVIVLSFCFTITSFVIVIEIIEVIESIQSYINKKINQAANNSLVIEKF